jgi:hypothetical protein
MNFPDNLGAFSFFAGIFSPWHGSGKPVTRDFYAAIV